MSRNIYDLFNERKNGVDCLVEGCDFTLDNAMEFGDLDECAEALNQITMEATNEMIELQAAWYLEDLVIENMMYENFDEEKIQSVMESSANEKSSSLGEKIKNLWKKIKEWFAGAFKAITVHFQSGETLVGKYKKEIPGAMQQSKAKVKMRGLNDHEAARKQVDALVSRLETTGKSKEQILGLVGLSDKGGTREKVENIYYSTKEATEHEISKLDWQLVMKYAGNKKILIDGLKKNQKDIDGKFKEILSKIKSGDADNKAEEAANFQFGIGIANGLLSAEISVVSAICKACVAIIRKALSGKHDANKGRDTEAPDTADIKKAKKDEKKHGKLALDGPVAKKEEPGTGLAAVRKESFEIIDEEEENNDDFTW